MNNIHLQIVGSKPFFDLLNELNLNYTFSVDKNFLNNNENFLVRIIFIEKLQLVEIKKYFLENVPTIFLSNNKDYLKKNNLSLLEFHISLFFPVEILSFREIINILIIKYNFFKKSRIIINDYIIDSNQRVIMKNSIKTKITEKELKLILALNKKNGLKKSFLLKCIWNYNLDLESHAFETHLYRLRKKMYKFFKDKNFLIERNSLYYLSK